MEWGCAAAASLSKRRRGWCAGADARAKRGLGRGLRGRLLEAGEDGLGLLEQDGAEDQPNDTEEHDATDRTANGHAGDLALGEPTGVISCLLGGLWRLSGGHGGGRLNIDFERFTHSGGGGAEGGGDLALYRRRGGAGGQGDGDGDDHACGGDDDRDARLVDARGGGVLLLQARLGVV